MMQYSHPDGGSVQLMSFGVGKASLWMFVVANNCFFYIFANDSWFSYFTQMHGQLLVYGIVNHYIIYNIYDEYETCVCNAM